MSLGEAAHAAKDVVQNQKGDSAILRDILESVGSDSDYSERWSDYVELEEMVHVIPASLLWSLVKSAIQPIGRVSYWWYSVSSNIQTIILARAVVLGKTPLEAGLSQMLDMHERLARGGNMALQIKRVLPGQSLRDNTWSGLAAEVNLLLLNSRFATVVESAFTGFGALVESNPKMIPRLLGFGWVEKWQLQWLLTAAEVWAVKYPVELSQCEDVLMRVLDTGILRLRLQVWIVLKLLARTMNTTPPDFIFRDANAENQMRPEKTPSQGILSTQATSLGHFHLVNRYESALGAIERVETTTSISFTQVEPRLAPKLLNQTRLNLEKLSWEKHIRNRSDSLCISEESDDLTDFEFDQELAQKRMTVGQMLNFAQGYLPSEDGWTLLQTPQPHPNMDLWPPPDKLTSEASKPIKAEELRSIFRRLAFELGIANDETVIGAKLRAYSHNEDFEYCCWWHETESNNISFPTTLSGRTFCWMLNENWWEPNWSVGHRPACFFVGGQMQLLRCSPEVIPSRLWVSRFGWKPHLDNPFVWAVDSKPVARFEVLHGICDSIRSRAARQPILHRWVVNRDAWNKALQAMPKLKWQQNFSRVSNQSDR